MLMPPWGLEPSAVGKFEPPSSGEYVMSGKFCACALDV